MFQKIVGDDAHIVPCCKIQRIKQNDISLHDMIYGRAA